MLHFNEMHYLLFLILSISILILPHPILAQETDQFITIVNPIRISRYSTDPGMSLFNQYNLIKINNLSASWLLTFDALENNEIITVVKSMHPSQDIGIFMEVTENSATKSDVKYNKTDSWHRSTSVFLSGYTQSDRIKLIDTVFAKFKNTFGYYPTSVGAWWIDSFSLEYMQTKYSVTANLAVADQFDTDGYTIWGQYWATPYYPSKIHSAIPASDKTNKIDVVNLQWAPRDPLNGYISPVDKNRASLYSTQDYHTLPAPHSYFEKLIELYAGKNNNQFGQITFGLEGDFSPENYTEKGQYGNYIKIAKKFADTGKYQVINMKNFSQWYRNKFPDISPPYTLYSQDLLETNKDVLWYQSPKYRIGIFYDQNRKSLKIVDLRSYANNFQEPFYTTTNKQLDLYINLPAVINGANYKSEVWEIQNMELLDVKTENQTAILTFSGDKTIQIRPDKIKLYNLGKLPQTILTSSFINKRSGFNYIELYPDNNYPVSEEGYQFRSLTLEATYFLHQRKIKIILAFSLVLLILISFIPKSLLRIFFLSIILVPLFLWYYSHSTLYYVSQSEIDALLKLKSFPNGNILVLDEACLQCSWQTKFRPAALANKRNYITKISNKNLVYDDKFIEKFSNNSFTKTEIPREQVKNYLQKLNVKYIYLIKHEDYREKLPYSPGDSSAEEIFINSDAQIWKINL